MEDTQALKELFVNVGIDPKVADSTLKNKKVTQRLKETIDLAGIKEGNKTVGNLLYVVATKTPDSLTNKLKFLADYVTSGKFVKPAQVDEAIDYLKKHNATSGNDKDINVSEFERAAGVGVVVTDEEVQALVNRLFEENKAEILEEKHAFNFNTIIYKARDELKWADQKKMLDLINKTKLDLIGEAPKGGAAPKKKAKPAKEPAKEENKKEEEETKLEGTGKKISDLVGRDMNSAVNTEEMLKKHREATGGKIMTRFPPEPNGYLHIGHAKAMRFNFAIANETGGHCYLRYDDTNPVKENQEFIDNIKTCCTWLGHEPYKITYSSDYFDELYEFALQLIRNDKAYVCHMTKDQIKESREKLTDSPYRTRSVEENLDLFVKMKDGRFAENECCLRLKIDMKHVNPCMRDPVAYRIRYVPHPHAGDKWCIYPTYDYTHCIVDSLENITHSLCTLEFEIRRESYYWLLEALNIYKPFVWEYSRLNLTYACTSKRKLEKLVGDKIVSGWDDPRLITILGLKRRGYTPSMINDFCQEIGVSRKGNENITSIKLLEFFARRELDREAPRTFGVLEPILLEIVNLEDAKELEIEAPLFPTDKTRGSQKYHLGKHVYIEKDDFSEVHRGGFYGLSPEQKVCLKYGPVVELVEVVKNGDKIDHVKVKIVKNFEGKLKGYIHWVTKEHSINAEVRVYNYLFTTPELPKEGWIEKINPESLIVKNEAKLWKSLKDSNENSRFQFERLGYFVYDRDSVVGGPNEKLVFNRIVELKESKEKKINMGKQ